MALDVFCSGNLTSDSERKEWPERNGRKAETYVSVRIASNPRFGKGAKFVEAKFRRPFTMGIAASMRKGEPIVVKGEMTERVGKDGKVWAEIYDADFVVLPPKKHDLGDPSAPMPGDADDAFDEAGGADAASEDLPF